MKANAPEKIYFDGESKACKLPIFSSQNIEYTRADAFIEKACDWLENNLKGIVGGSIYIEDFKEYLKK